MVLNPSTISQLPRFYLQRSRVKNTTAANSIHLHDDSFSSLPLYDKKKHPSSPSAIIAVNCLQFILFHVKNTFEIIVEERTISTKTKKEPLK